MGKSGIIIIIIILVLPWIGVTIYWLTKKSRAKKYYMRLQEKYKLSQEQGGKHIPILSGFYRLRPVRIENSNTGNKNITLLTVTCENPDNFEFKITKRNKPSKSGYSADAQTLGDIEFDDRFIISTNNLERLRKLFDFNTRFKLQQVSSLGFKGEIRLLGNSFTYFETGLLKSDESVMRFELVLHELCDLADVMKYN